MWNRPLVFLEAVMKRVLLVLVALVLFAPAAFADITVTTSLSMLAAGMTMNGTLTTFIKGTKFRADTNLAGQNLSQLLDTATKQQWTINHGTKTIEPLNPAQGMAALPITFGDPKATVTPIAEAREILGRKCQGFTVEIVIPITINGESVTMKMAGPAWVSKEGAGVAEYKAAQKALSEAGLSTSPMSQSGPQGKALAEATKALTDAGMVLEQELKMTMEGTGPMAQALGQAAGATITMKVTGVTTDAIPDAKFALPEGYTKK
jgi:hypothetical protein